ncbi:MAG TPA: cobaltochelatase subunit CobN [Pyrinomonadaceae bacterium]|jgi:magnesium chelatase subunit H|nr:cobaltochelatase subunit CobN [Pyrinomonadaceae bacterium]
MTEKLSSIERDARVMALSEELIEIEQRLIPTGLHVFGRAAELKEKADLLRMVASFDRPELGTTALPTLVAEALGIEGYAELLHESPTSETRELIDGIVSEAVQRFCERGAESAANWLNVKTGVDAEKSLPTFSVLTRVAEQLDSNSELESLMRALNGEYISPGPGADIVQNPLVLPTGRNTHAVNPYSVPSQVAFSRAKFTADALLGRYKDEHGSYPRAIALVLWGLDNIKTQGEGVAQALWLLGVRPVRDALNRATEVEIIPLEELQRPRIDVVMTVSGIFRDLFAPTMTLLDKAVRRVAVLDESPEMNYVRRNISEGMEQRETVFDDAVTRVFSNAPGNYGTNVNFMVMDSQWDTAETLGDLFVTRKCFAYSRNSQGRAVEGREAPQLMDDALSRVEATFQNLDSFEVGITDVDHYFEYLGGVSKAVETRTKVRPAIYLADSLSPQTRVRSLQETVRLESRSKTLNPKWYEGMLKHGFRGVAEIENHVANTFGWSATADAVDPWIYTEISKTFLLDSTMFNRLLELNPHSVQSLTKRLIEAHDRGYWNPDEAVLEKLRELAGNFEDRFAGVL